VVKRHQRNCRPCSMLSFQVTPAVNKLPFMTKPRQRWLIIGGGLVLVVIVVTLVASRGPAEPTHDGKKLSTWLDEISAMTFPHQCDPDTKPAQAVRAIGTNAIPWLIDEMGTQGSTVRWRLNKLLARQNIIRFRFLEHHTQVRRACMGFAALGPMAEPAIPDLLKLADVNPGYVPSALAYIGPPAIPALQQCLTNYYSMNSSVGRLVPIPNNTISAIFNAIQAQRLSNSHAALFLPAVKAWAQSTNKNPAVGDSSQLFLQTFDSTNGVPSR
jgi:hypothetical protein